MQGWVNTGGQIVKQFDTEELCRSSLKAKVVGTYGNIRAFASKKIDDDNSVDIHEVCATDLNYHETLDRSASRMLRTF